AVPWCSSSKSLPLAEIFPSQPRAAALHIVLSFWLRLCQALLLIRDFFFFRANFPRPHDALLDFQLWQFWQSAIKFLAVFPLRRVLDPAKMPGVSVFPSRGIYVCAHACCRHGRRLCCCAGFCSYWSQRSGLGTGLSGCASEFARDWRLMCQQRRTRSPGPRELQAASL